MKKIYLGQIFRVTQFLILLFTPFSLVLYRLTLQIVKQVLSQIIFFFFHIRYFRNKDPVPGLDGSVVEQVEEGSTESIKLI